MAAAVLLLASCLRPGRVAVLCVREVATFLMFFNVKTS